MVAVVTRFDTVMTPSRAALRLIAASAATSVALATRLVNVVAGRDSVVPSRFVPLTATLTVLPRVPLAGVTAVAATWPVMNTPALVPLPPACVTVIGPLVASPGTVTLMDVVVTV